MPDLVNGAPLKLSAPSQRPRLTELPDEAITVRSQAADEHEGDSRLTQALRLMQSGRRRSDSPKWRPQQPVLSMSTSSTHSLCLSRATIQPRLTVSTALSDSLQGNMSCCVLTGPTPSRHFTPHKYWGVFARIVSHVDWPTALTLRRTSRLMREMVERSFPRELWLYGTEREVLVGFFEVEPARGPAIVLRRIPFFASTDEGARGRQAATLWRATSVEISGEANPTLNVLLRCVNPRMTVLVRRLVGTHRHPLMLPRVENLIVDAYHMRSLRLHMSHNASGVYLVWPHPRFCERAARRITHLLNPGVKHLYIEVGGRRTAQAVAELFTKLKKSQAYPYLVCEMGHRGVIIEWECVGPKLC